MTGRASAPAAAPRRRLLLGGGLLLAGCGGIATLPDPVLRFPVWLALAAVATAGWLLGFRAARSGEGGRRALAPILATGLAARALLLVPVVPLSDDLYRYLWDGRVANAGYNPFRWAPADPALAPLRDPEIWPRINHPDVPTIYPPVAQLAFRALDAAAPTPLAARAASALLDLAAAGLLALVLRARGLPPALAVVHAWCPLAIQESAGGGHVDALGIALFVGAFAAGARPAAQGLLVALSCCVKPVAIVAGPALLAAGPARRRIALVLGALAALVVFVPYLDAGAMLARGFLTYAEHWRFNDLAYGWVARTGLGPRESRWVLAGVLAAFAIAAPFRWREPLAASGLGVGALLLLSPTVHPWYVAWLVPFLPFLPGWARPAGFVLVALAPVSYAAAWGLARTGDWAEPEWSRIALWGPVVASLAAGLIVRLRAPRVAAGGARER
jgi:hypothetical protein